MVLLHPYKEAALTQIFLEKPLAENPPGREVLDLLFGINDWLGVSGISIYGTRQGKTVYVLYKNAVLLIEDFWNYAAFSMACINRKWSICAFGTADNQDSVRLSAKAEGEAVRLSQHTLSGESAEIVRTLCFQIDCADIIMAEKLSLFLRTMDWQIGIAAMNWQEADFLRGQNLMIEPEYRSHFCYAGLNRAFSEKNLMDALSFSQKTALWIAFLKDGFAPAEFEWLAEAISNEILDNRMEWELSLREAMNQLHFQVINRNKDFEIYDGTGQRRYFGADLRRPAEWALLKILFPISY